jgi:KUP system potassium uptake protein
MSQAHSQKTPMHLLTLGALGIVFGDIGTSPLYALKECFHASHGLAITHDNILGLLSVIFWSITLVVSIKYVAFIMRADNNGEGGIMALLALSLRNQNIRPWQRMTLVSIGLFGAALFFGDGIITPAISVLSAVEGLKLITPVFDAYILPITIAY